MKYLNPRQLENYKKRVVTESYKFGATKASRMYGLPRSTVYNWRISVREKKRGPQNRPPWQTPAHLERIVVRLRQQTNYGPKRLRVELDYHGISLGEKAIRGILKRKGLSKKYRRKRKKTPQVFYAPYAGYRLQVDTKVVPDNLPDKRSGERYQFTAIDIYTRIRFLRIYEDLSNHNSIDFLRQALEFYKAIGITFDAVQTDNHATFTNLYLGGKNKSEHEALRVHPLTLFLVNQGINHILSRPATPKDNTFVERSHRTDMEEFYRTIKLQEVNLSQLNKKVDEWLFFYNFLRPHSSCDNLPPIKYHLTVQ